MDAFLSFLIDGVFFFVGKGIWWLLKKIQIPIPEFSHWGYVALGFIGSVFICLFIFFTFGMIYG